MNPKGKKSEHHVEKKASRKTKHSPTFALPIIGLVVGLILAFVYIKWTGKSLPQVSPISSTHTTPTPSPTPGPAPISLLLMGYGGPDHDGGYLTDTIIQVVVRPQEKKVLMISIPRDLSVSIPISDTQKEEEKINAAFAIGIDDKDYPKKPVEFQAKTNPGALSKRLISDITGIPIDSYIALSFDGFVKAIDTLGGVDVNFDQSFDDYRYPTKGKEKDTCGMSDDEVASLSAALKGDELEQKFPCRYEHIHVDKGVQHLSRELALKVARSRHSLNLRGDFSRSERQRAIIQAVKERIFEIGFLPKAIPFFLSLGKDVKTDIDVGFLTSLLPYAQDLRSYTIISIALSDENVLDQGTNGRGQYVLLPHGGNENWNEIRDFIQMESTKSAITKEISPTQTVRPTSAK